MPARVEELQERIDRLDWPGGFADLRCLNGTPFLAFAGDAESHERDIGHILAFLVERLPGSSARTGRDPGLAEQVRHVFPRKFSRQFEDAGINIHQPNLMVWWGARRPQLGFAAVQRRLGRLLREQRTAATSSCPRGRATSS